MKNYLTLPPMTNFATPLVVDQIFLATHMLSTSLPERLAKHSVFFPSLGFIKHVMSLSCLGSFHFFIFPFRCKCLCKVTEKEVYNLLGVLQDLENTEERSRRGTWCQLAYPWVHTASPRSPPASPRSPPSAAAGCTFLIALA